MKRGDIWTVAGGGEYTSKPRPAVILQSDQFDEIDSVTVCLVTSEEVGGFVARILVRPTTENGLQAPSYLMVDKITTLRRTRLGQRVGELSAEDMSRLA
ncbi:MAG: type II toxin-antitoxin system PemK/MazF family toxin, partial [Tepidiformaceae bacterium]